MKKILILLVFAAAVAAGVGYFFKDSIVERESEYVIGLKSEASKMFPSDSEKQKQWVTDNINYKSRLDSLPYDKTSGDYKKVLELAEKAHPGDFSQRYDFVVSRMIAVEGLKNLATRVDLGDKEYEIVRRMAAKSSDDFQRQLEHANELYAIISEIKKQNDGQGITPQEFAKLYGNFIKDFEASPKTSAAMASQSIEAIRNFNFTEYPEKFNGVKELIKSKYESPVERLKALRSVLEGNLEPLGLSDEKVYCSVEDWKNSKDPAIKSIFESSVYFARVGDIDLPVFFVSLNGKNFFVTSAKILENGIKDIEIKKGDETLKCSLAKYGIYNYGVVLVPDKIPTATPLNANNVKSSFDKLQILGKNLLNMDVNDTFVPMAADGSKVSMYSSEVPQIISHSSIVWDDSPDSFVAFKAGGTFVLDEDKISMTVAEKDALFAESEKMFPGLEKNINACKRMPLSQFLYEPCFLRIPAIAANPTVNLKDEEKNLALLNTLARQNRAMIKALAKNEFAYMIGEEFSKEYPEISNAAKLRAKIFMGDRKISRVNFNRAYVQHLREMSNILNQSLVVLDSKKSVIYPLYFQREMEIRKALVNTFWNILKARNLSIENVVYKDLAGGFDANYYTPPKKQ